MSNNNLSVLPFYDSIGQQNARKWWVYGRIYPLFTPATYILPFQVQREHREQNVSFGVGTLPQSNDIINGSGVWEQSRTATCVMVDVKKYRSYPMTLHKGANAITYAFTKAGISEGNNVEFATGYNSIVTSNADVNTSVPSDANYLYLLATVSGNPYAPEIIDTTQIRPINSFHLYKSNGIHWIDITTEIVAGMEYKQVGDKDILVYAGDNPFTPSFSNGQYYAVMSDGIDRWYSEVFTSVNDIEPYLKIEWWDEKDFVMDAGTIVYTEPAFKNILYLDSDLAKPEYTFEEEGENRDGYFFPIKQISEKRYRFSFLASEYLLDVMRLIRMADHIVITYHNQEYRPDSFLITPQWESNGDVAAVEGEFETDTVAKKLPTIL